MNSETKKETSTTPTKAQVEVQNRKKKKSFSLKVYHNYYDLSSPIHLKSMLDHTFPDKKCVCCGKSFVPTKPEYAWEDCCSYTCYRHRGDEKKKPHMKPVDQYTKEGKFIGHFKSAVEAAIDAGLKKADGIRDCCNGKTKTSGGFVWRWSEVKND